MKTLFAHVSVFYCHFWCLAWEEILKLTRRWFLISTKLHAGMFVLSTFFFCLHVKQTVLLCRGINVLCIGKFLSWCFSTVHNFNTWWQQRTAVSHHLSGRSSVSRTLGRHTVCMCDTATFQTWPTILTCRWKWTNTRRFYSLVPEPKAVSLTQTNIFEDLVGPK